MAAMMAPEITKLIDVTGTRTVSYRSSGCFIAKLRVYKLIQ
jgi:hypothetical protein